MSPTPKIYLEAAAYDPSHRRVETASYWQWSNRAIGKQWDLAAECVNKGFPANLEFRDRSVHWYGFIADEDGKFWIYRIFAAGNDRFGREGRYFFILIRLQGKQDVLNPNVAGLFHYFETERGLPLKTEPLVDGWREAIPDETLKAISKELDRKKSLGHWGMTDGGHITVFSEVSPLLRTPSPGNSTEPASTRVAQGPGRQTAKELFLQQRAIFGKILGYVSKFTKLITQGLKKIYTRLRATRWTKVKLAGICTVVALLVAPLIVLLSVILFVRHIFWEGDSPIETIPPTDSSSTQLKPVSPEPDQRPQKTDIDLPEPPTNPSGSDVKTDPKDSEAIKDAKSK